MINPFEMFLPGCRPAVCLAKAERRRPLPGNLPFLRFARQFRNTSRNSALSRRSRLRPEESNLRD